MPKKSFKDNPALQFISTIDTEGGADGADIEAAESKDTAETPPRAVYNREAKSRRLQLLLTPSLYRRVKDGAAELGFSVNEYINQILDVATKGE